MNIFPWWVWGWAEASTRDIIKEKLFLKTLYAKMQYSWKNTCVGISFNKVAGRPEDLQLYQKETPTKAVFLWILQNVYKHLFLQNNFSGCFQISIKGGVPFHCCSFFVANHSSFPHRFTSLFVCFTLQKWVVTRSKVTCYLLKNHSELIAKTTISPCKKPLIGRCKNHLLQKSLVSHYKHHSLLFTY